MTPDQQAAYERIVSAQQEVDAACTIIDVALDDFLLALQNQRTVGTGVNGTSGAMDSTNEAAAGYIAAMKASVTAVRELVRANLAQARLLAGPPT